MINLSYSACYDPYNAIFRMVAVLRSAPNNNMLVETLRVADFFLCFPTRITEVRPPNSVSGMRGRKNRFLKNLKFVEYEILPSSSVLFERMKVFQEAALSAMAANSLAAITGEGDRREVKLKETQFRRELEAQLQQYETSHSELLEITAKDFPRIQLFGVDGLKARTGLGEYQYDAV